ncbi:response regulator [Marinobacter daepoensis]|nr:response regulator [Marinobacter daepoensis]
MMNAAILLVEDDQASLELAAYLLEHYGFQVFRAEDGLQGLNTALGLGADLDLILSDIQMPEMDGYQLLRALRADPLLACLPVVAITAFSMEGDEQEILQAGFNGYISKPIDPERFVDQVREWLPSDNP